MRLTRGQRVRFEQMGLAGQSLTLAITARAADLAIDVACFGLDAAGGLSDERYLVFFNQPETPCSGVRLGAGATAAGETVFELDLQRLPAGIERLVFTASIDAGGQLSALAPGQVLLRQAGAGGAHFDFSGADFATERAVMLFEIYRRDGGWRVCPVAQGFDGGLDALVRHFGGEVAAPGVAAPVSMPVPARISLEKRIEREAPRLVGLAKAAAVSLEKKGLGTHRARVCLCLDISGSMRKLYASGAMQTFAERILALGCRFDDDGEIDVFLFGEQVHHPAPMGLANCQRYVAEVLSRHGLEGDTRYGRAMQAIRRFYFSDAGGGERTAAVAAELPVYVMFVTDGGTNDKSLTERQLRWSSREPIFWQFMGIGKGRKSRDKRLLSFADSDFPFLEKLDELDGRLIDNAGFFPVAAPDEYPDAALYDLLMQEYPQWVQHARQHGLVP